MTLRHILSRSRSWRKKRSAPQPTLVAGTGKKLWWKCPVANDHEWQTTGAHRVSGRGCPV